MPRHYLPFLILIPALVFAKTIVDKIAGTLTEIKASNSTGSHCVLVLHVLILTQEKPFSLKIGLQQ
jgi:hypothetical protein